jgi:hypothetical protein
MSPRSVPGAPADACGAVAEVLDAAELVDIEGGFFPTPVFWDPQPSPWLPIPFLQSALW